MISPIKRPRDLFNGTQGRAGASPENIIIWTKQKRSSSREYKGTAFDRMFLFINLEGENEVLVDSTRYRLPDRHGILIFPHQFHRVFDHFDKLYWLVVTFDMQAHEELEVFRNCPFRCTDQLMQDLENLTDYYRTHSVKSPEHGSRVSLLLSLVLNTMRYSVGPVKRAGRLTKRKLVDDINDFIAENIKSDVRLETIAERFHYSVSRLRSIYRDEMQITIGKYIQEVKLNKARSMLSHSNSPVSKVANECGYDSVFTFSTIFKRRMKCSPLEFRKRSSGQK